MCLTSVPLRNLRDERAAVAAILGMKINIKSLKDRKTFTIDVQPTFDAGDVKRVIEQEQNLPASAQRLVFGGKPLRVCARWRASKFRWNAT